MKNNIQYFFSLIIICIALNSCKASKGCGLTSDVHKIEHHTSLQTNNFKAETK